MYNCKRIPTGWRIIKWSDDLEVEASYELELVRGWSYRCQCFQGNKPSCRHRVMLEAFIKYKALDSNLFYDYDGGKWVTPVKEPFDTPIST